MLSLSQTANLPTKLKVCACARVMLTDNISACDRRSKPFCSTVYVKFDNPKAGYPLKDRWLRGELKECVPITARAKSTVIADPLARKLQRGRIVNNLNIRGKFIPYFPVPKIRDKVFF